MRLLLAEDDRTIRDYVAQGLREARYAVDAVSDGEEALNAASAVAYDLVILDIGLPRFDGIEVCRQLRASRNSSGCAILFLTARDAVADRVVGLDAGADDYLVKPFAFVELLARVRALLRRGGGEQPILSVADLTLDPATHRVARGDLDLRLTAKEFALLEYFIRNSGKVLTKRMIAEHVWDMDLDAESNFIEVLVYSLRRKVDAPFQQAMIETIRGAGYRLNGK